MIQHKGLAVEFLAAAELNSRGHEIAFPMADSPVDIVADYSVRIQVKSGLHRPKGRGVLVINLGGRRGFRADTSDYVVAYSSDLCEWWVIPTADLKCSTNLHLGKMYDCYRDAWHLIPCPGRAVGA